MEPVPETAENRVRERKRPMQCQDSLKKVLSFEEVVVGIEKILGFEEVVSGVVNRTDGIRNCPTMSGPARDDTGKSWDSRKWSQAWSKEPRTYAIVP